MQSPHAGFGRTGTMAKAAKKAKRAARRPVARKPVAKKAKASKKSAKTNKTAVKKAPARAKPSANAKKAPKKQVSRRTQAAPKRKAAARVAPRKKAVTKKAVTKKAAKKKVAKTNRSKAPAKKPAKRPVRIAPRPKPSAPTPGEKERLKAAQALRESEGRQAKIYGKGVKSFNSKRYPQALKLFEEVAAGPHPSLRHRAGVYVEICRQRLRPRKVKFKTADEYYNYGIQLVNERRLDEAESQFRHALKMQPKAAHVHLASAVLGALSGNIEKTYKSLKKAIDLDPRSRVLALNDADLSSVLNEPAIAELLHGNGARWEST